MRAYTRPICGLFFSFFRSGHADAKMKVTSSVKWQPSLKWDASVRGAICQSNSSMVVWAMPRCSVAWKRLSSIHIRGFDLDVRSHFLRVGSVLHAHLLWLFVVAALLSGTIGKELGEGSLPGLLTSSDPTKLTRSYWSHVPAHENQSLKLDRIASRVHAVLLIACTYMRLSTSTWSGPPVTGYWFITVFGGSSGLRWRVPGILKSMFLRIRVLARNS